MKCSFRRFLQQESAVTSIEYALLAALIAVVIVSGVTLAGTGVVQIYNYVKDQVVLATQ